MPEQDQSSRLRFDSFELDLQTRELRKDGRLIKLQDQPVKLLAMLASRAGELVTRGEIEKALWGDGEIVEFEHSINTAMRKIREALGDDLEKPRFIETLPRKGYRFIAPVQTDPVIAPESPSHAEASAPARNLRDRIPVRSQKAEPTPPVKVKNIHPEPATPSEAEFALPRGMARALFLTTQVGYLAIYGSALYLADDLEGALGRVLMVPAGLAIPLIIVSAMCGIAVRLYLLSSVGLDHPAAGSKFRWLFPSLFVLDTLWAASPLLLVRKIGYGLALGSVAALAYLPFAQRTLIQSIYRGGKSTDSAISRV